MDPRWPLRAVSEGWRSHAVLQGSREDMDLVVADSDALIPLGLTLCRSAAGAWFSLEGVGPGRPRKPGVRWTPRRPLGCSRSPIHPCAA